MKAMERAAREATRYCVSHARIGEGLLAVILARLNKESGIGRNEIGWVPEALTQIAMTPQYVDDFLLPNLKKLSPPQTFKEVDFGGFDGRRVRGVVVRALRLLQREPDSDLVKAAVPVVVDVATKLKEEGTFLAPKESRLSMEYYGKC